MATKHKNFPEVDAALRAAAEEGVEEYQDRRATPAPARDYRIEDEPDPILAFDGKGAAPVIEEPFIDEGDDAGTGAEGDDAGPAIEIPPNADPIARLAAAMELIARRPQATYNDGLMSKLVEVLEKVASGQAASTSAAAQALLKGKDPSNFFSTEVSCFNPRGEREYPRPMLKCRMHLPWEAERESLTREEIELLNLLLPGKYFVTRNDKSRIEVTVNGRINSATGQMEVLLMNSETGFNNDYAWLMPPMADMLRQMLKQRMETREAEAGVMTMEREVELIAQYGVHFDKVMKGLAVA